MDAAREYQQVIKGLDQEIIVPSRLEDQISKLEDELRLTVSEERELLAELANLDREEEQLKHNKSNRSTTLMRILFIVRILMPSTQTSFI